MTGMTERIATERICRTADGTYVPEHHPAAAFLVVGIGGPLPADFAGFDQPTDITVDATPAEATDTPVVGESGSDEDEAPPAPVKKPKTKN